MLKTCAFLLAFLLPLSYSADSTTPKDDKAAKIQIALLLDTSNSMDGLIDQAKSQLWKMVNKLAASQKDGAAPALEIALYEYGNDNLSAGEGYVRMVSSLTTDADNISEKLFALKTRGGSEYCGWVIGDAVNDLKWSTDDKDLKIILIAGNEPFDQGPKEYKKMCEKAKEKNIVINTIFCGGWQEGIQTHWKDGADIAKGMYLNIEQDKKIIHIRTPWDEKMIEINIRLNKTYIGYGSSGKMMKERQTVQDANAAEYGVANAASRTAYKAKAQYRNDEWDLVDAAEKDENVVEKLKKEDLPEEMHKMSAAERKTYVAQLRKERAALREEIKDLEKKIQEYTFEELKKMGSDNTLDKVMMGAVMEQAKSKGFIFDEK
jgi:hypothetical protein